MENSTVSLSNQTVMATMSLSNQTVMTTMSLINQTVMATTALDVMANATTPVPIDEDNPFAVVEMYVMPIITFAGLIGNSLSFVVLVQLSQQSSFYLYLAGLALSDTMVLIVNITRWLDNLGAIHLYKSVAEMHCSAWSALGTGVAQLSSWITVAVTVDRYIAVCHPFKVAIYCTRKRAIVTMVGLFLALAALNAPEVCLEWDADYLTCLYPEITQAYCFDHITYLDFCTYVMVPFCFLCVFDALIVRELIRTARRRRKLTNSGESSTTGVNQVNDTTRRTTVMLFAVISIFFLTIGPLGGIILYTVFSGRTLEYYIEYNPALIVFPDVFACFNHAGNFIMYGLSGKIFREKFVKLLCFRRTQNTSRANTATTTKKTHT